MEVKKSVSTNIFTLWDDVSGTQLRMSGNNTNLSIAFWVPEVSQDGRRKYPQEKRYIAMLTPKTVEALKIGILEDIISAYLVGKDAARSIFTNANKSTALEISVKAGEFYATLYRNCDPFTFASKDSVVFKFASSYINKDYDPNTGEVNAEMIPTDFYIFASAVKAYSDSISGLIAGHGVKQATSFRNTEYQTYLRAIANAVHANVVFENQYNQGYGAQGNYNQYPQYNTQSAPQTQTAEPVMVDDISEIM